MLQNDQDIYEEQLEGTFREDRFYALSKLEGIPAAKFEKIMQERKVFPAFLLNYSARSRLVRR